MDELWRVREAAPSFERTSFQLLNLPPNVVRHADWLLIGVIEEEDRRRAVGGKNTVLRRAPQSMLDREARAADARDTGANPDGVGKFELTAEVAGDVRHDRAVIFIPVQAGQAEAFQVFNARRFEPAEIDDVIYVTE